MWSIPLPSLIKRTTYCPYHIRNSPTLEQCVNFRRIFDEKQKTSEILFQMGVMSIDDVTFPKYNEEGKGHVIIGLHVEMEIKGDKAHQPESEPDLESMA